MLKSIIYELIAISFYVMFVYYAFCDGFNVKPLRKIAWAVVFLWTCFVSLQYRNGFDLLLILPVPSALALFLCWHEKKTQVKKA